MPHRDFPPFHRRSVRFAMPQSLLGRVVGLVLPLTLGVVLFAFSLVLLAVGAMVGTLVWLWFRWRVRAARPRMATQPPHGGDRQPPSGRVFDGEVLSAERDSGGRDAGGGPPALR